VIWTVEIGGRLQLVLVVIVVAALVVEWWRFAGRVR
jgi:hypothetical protein